MKPDFGATAADYGRHRAGFPDSLFDRLARFGIGRRGQMVVDLGTGTGTLARGFARRGCRALGIDVSRPLLGQARALDAEVRMRVEYVAARAERIALAPRVADAVTAGQCWHWFDRPAAAREAARVLRPDGWLVIAHFDWLPRADNVVGATERLIETHNPSWAFGGGVGMYPQWLSDLGDASFRQIESFSYDVEVPYAPEAWRGRVRASAGIGASLPPEQVAAFDRELGALLAERFPEPMLSVPHRVFAVVARAPGR